MILGGAGVDDFRSDFSEHRANSVRFLAPVNYHESTIERREKTTKCLFKGKGSGGGFSCVTVVESDRHVFEKQSTRVRKVESMFCDAKSEHFGASQCCFVAAAAVFCGSARTKSCASQCI